MAQEPIEVKQRLPRRHKVLVVLFAAVVVFWALVTVALTSAPTEVIAPVEARMRDTRVARTLIPPMKHGRPIWLDLLEHFVVYAPFGIMAGVGADIAGRRHGRRRFWIVFVLFLVGSMCWALFDEYRQITLPDRSANWDDLSAGWSGILTGALLYLGARKLITMVTRRKLPKMSAAT